MKFRLGGKDAIKYSKVGMKIEGSDTEKPILIKHWSSMLVVTLMFSELYFSFLLGVKSHTILADQLD